MPGSAQTIRRAGSGSTRGVGWRLFEALYPNNSIPHKGYSKLHATFNFGAISEAASREKPLQLGTGVQGRGARRSLARRTYAGQESCCRSARKDEDDNVDVQIKREADNGLR